MWGGLSRAILVSACIIAGHATDPFEPSNVQAFVEKQLSDFLSDCGAYADSFSSKFDYDDTVRISDNKAELLDLCRAAEGTVTELHTGLSIKPGSFPSPGFHYIATTGMQSACVDFGDGEGFQPLCMDFVFTEILQAQTGAPLGLASVNWTGYYNVLGKSCAGFEPLACPNVAR